MQWFRKYDSHMNLYKIVLGAMGPRLDVSIVETLRYHKVTISPRDAVI